MAKKQQASLTVEAEAPKEQEAPKKKTAKKPPEGVWNCNLYIRGYGRVNQGDATTSEALELLKDNASKYVE